MSFGTKDALEITELTRGQADHWSKLGLLGPTDTRTGKGGTRTFEVRDLVAVKAMQMVMKTRPPLERLKHVAEVANRWHDEYAEDVAHERRNPLDATSDVVLLISSDGTVSEFCSPDLIAALGDSPAVCLLRKDKILGDLLDVTAFATEKLFPRRRGRGRPRKEDAGAAVNRKGRREHEAVSARANDGLSARPQKGRNKL